MYMDIKRTGIQNGYLKSFSAPCILCARCSNCLFVMT